ncbi:DHH family phosphoesterase [Chengkuizengella axinellae]|uniref:Cyclic-di-AMP phosphodiesterase n=1 Tax=Chengkuizengella axinellae TaxID=3064388 RepID=A0ABT9J4Z2_9BACL|nr:DHH family phosphoesterase [Chengkuizengella sp. 2205SS18-9]MDP5276060.1 DHH family phosphoesterase [Chengkuizengella sp. 2205SS18-9]
MPKFLMNRWQNLHTIFSYILFFALIIVMFVYEWIIAVVALVIGCVLLLLSIRADKTFHKDLHDYVMTLSHRVKKAGNEVIHELPIGMVLYDEEKKIEWHNPYIAQMLNKESVIGESVNDIFPVFEEEDENAEYDVFIHDQHYQVLKKNEERLIYFTNITDYKNLIVKHEEEKPAMGIIMMDNVDEATQGMDDKTRSLILAKVISELTEWSNQYGLYMRRISSDKFLMMMNQKILEALEGSRFDILDTVRDMTADLKIPLTLSIGISSGEDHLVELGSIMQTSLDIALGRGGDQAAIKSGQNLKFYGGRSNAVEKGTRVRARVISHALRELIRESENVMIMGHIYPDMDSIGAAIGLLKAARLSDKQGYIVLEDVNPAIQSLMDEVENHELLKQSFISPEQALQLIDKQTLVCVVDTHKASMVPEPRLLQIAQRIFVVDHHRRSEEFINEPTLVYIEHYASSTCELITEILQYFHDKISLDKLEATAMLAGIVVDTKSFSLRTGARTFEAASFLRRNGANSSTVQRMLKEDLHEYLQQIEIIKNAKIVYDHIAIAVAKPNHKNSQLIIAKVADTLLNMTDVMASLVISERPDGKVGLSARSLGEVNVQILMERMGGGGHFSNSGAQIEGSVEEVKERLEQVLSETIKEEGLLK